MNLDYAVYTETSDGLTNKAMLLGQSNKRVFNSIEKHSGNNIVLQEDAENETSVVRLYKGVYHITGSSVVTHSQDQNDSDCQAAASRSNGGYCMLMEWCDSETVIPITTGTVSQADRLPSLIDTYIEVNGDYMDIQLIHQCLDNDNELYLQVSEQSSRKSVFARLAIRRIANL